MPWGHDNGDPVLSVSVKTLTMWDWFVSEVKCHPVQIHCTQVRLCHVALRGRRVPRYLGHTWNQTDSPLAETDDLFRHWQPLCSATDCVLGDLPDGAKGKPTDKAQQRQSWTRRAPRLNNDNSAHCGASVTRLCFCASLKHNNEDTCQSGVSSFPSAGGVRLAVSICFQCLC